MYLVILECIIQLHDERVSMRALQNAAPRLLDNGLDPS
jgi:hypothetical protein